MKRRVRNGIIVAGCPRSGSTILAKILALSPQVGYVEEPFNFQTGMIGTDDRFFPYIYRGSAYQERYDQLLNEILSSQAHYKESVLQPPTHNPLRLAYRHFFTHRYQIRYWLDSHDPRVKTLVLKDPTASLCVEHFLNNPRLSAIYSLRHPCGVIASHIRLGWVGSPVEELTRDKKLAGKLSREVREVDYPKLMTVETLAWYWRTVNEIILQVLQNRPDIALICHEDFSRQPQAVCQQVFSAHNIPLDAVTMKKIDELTGADNPTDPTDNDIHVLKRNSQANVERWRKLLSKSDQTKIMAICAPLYASMLELPNRVTGD